eukprot:336278-Chlamydomonas_euryale.AAC.6
MFPGLDRSSKEAPPAPMTVKGGDPSLDAFQRAVRGLAVVGGHGCLDGGEWFGVVVSAWAEVAASGRCGYLWRLWVLGHPTSCAIRSNTEECLVVVCELNDLVAEMDLVAEKDLVAEMDTILRFRTLRSHHTLTRRAARPGQQGPRNRKRQPGRREEGKSG